MLNSVLAVMVASPFSSEEVDEEVQVRGETFNYEWILYRLFHINLSFIFYISISLFSLIPVLLTTTCKLCYQYQYEQVKISPICWLVVMSSIILDLTTAVDPFQKYKTKKRKENGKKSEVILPKPTYWLENNWCSYYNWSTKNQTYSDITHLLSCS